MLLWVSCCYVQPRLPVFIVCYGYANTTEVYRFADVFEQFHTVAKSVGHLYDVSPSAWNNSAPTGRIFIKCYIGDVY